MMQNNTFTERVFLLLESIIRPGSKTSIMVSQ